MNAERFEKVMLLLSSDKQGEVFAAANLIGRTLTENGSDWHKFSKIASRIFVGEEPPQQEREKPDDDDEEQNDEPDDESDEESDEDQHTRNPHHSRGPYITWDERHVVSWLKLNASLTDSERGLIRTLTSRIFEYNTEAFISPKQREWLHIIWKKKGPRG